MLGEAQTARIEVSVAPYAEPLGMLRTAVEDALAGRGRLVILGYERPGEGASALAGTADYAHRRGARVVRGACQGAGLPWDPWSRVLPGEPRAAIAHLLGRSGDGPPLVVLLEEMHRAERPAVLLLELLAALLPGSPLAVVATYDGGAPGDVLSAVLPEMARMSQSTDLVLWDGQQERRVRNGVPVPLTPTFLREGEYWTIAFGGRVIRMRDLNGLRYLAPLLRQPGVRVHVSDLRTTAVRRGGSTDLEAAVSTERVRVSVTKAIGAAIAHLTRELPELGNHLGVTVHRGYFCVYRPDPRQPVCWRT